MSVYNCHKQQPQPWMSYISPNKIVYPGECCPALVTGNRCNVDSVEIIYGYLYNWYAATDARNIAASGWHVPTRNDFDVLGIYLGGSFWGDGSYSGYYFGYDNIDEALRSDNVDYWDTPTGTNTSGFNATGAGVRLAFWGYSEITLTNLIWLSEVTLGAFVPDGTPMLFYMYDNYDGFIVAPGNDSPEKNQGASIRLIKDTTTLTHGQEGTYTGNDGKVYRTICIGTQEWLADNLAETKFRTGDDIPEVTDNAVWAALTTAGMCAYNNDWSNV